MLLEANPSAYARFLDQSTPLADVRRTMQELSLHVAAQLRQTLGYSEERGDQTLIVPVLRGGALMYPSFLSVFPEAHYSILGIRRGHGMEAEVLYSAEAPKTDYSTIIVVDCVANSGSTAVAAIKQLRRTYRSERMIVAVVSGAETATAPIESMAAELHGYRLGEKIEDGYVVPDFGGKDAGDVFSGRRAWL